MRRRKKQYTSRHGSRQYTKKRFTDQVDRALQNRILAELYVAQQEATVNDLVKSLGLPRSGRAAVEQALLDLCRDGSCRKVGKKHYRLHQLDRFVEATIEMKQGGFAFGVDLSPARTASKLLKDPYISAARTHSALHGDRVLLRLGRQRRNGRSEAEVIRVMQRGSRTLTGFYVSGKGYGSVYPEDPKFPFEIKLAQTPGTGVKDGDAVIVKLLDTADSRSWQGEIVTLLGDPDDFDVLVRLVVEKFSLVRDFSEEALDEAAAATSDPPVDRREDLRGIPHVTIDGADAKDYDDAIAVEKTQHGYRLYVSIADVSAFVPVGSQLDREAYARGTSIYLPGTVLPMLPEQLSNNLCSLLPDTDRMAVTAILEFDRDGRSRASRFTRSVIRSRQRFTYATVKQIAIDRDNQARKRYTEFTTLLDTGCELAGILAKNRIQRGSILFSTPEAAFAFDDDHRVLSVTKNARDFSHQLIEEFMLAANEAVAQLFNNRGEELLYRIHEEPDREKIAAFTLFAATLGLELPENQATPGWYNELIAKVDSTPHEFIVNNLLLRTMQQARYSPGNVGHFGLATELYCHFTSPIRRYPDLIVHRLLCWLLDQNAKGEDPPATSPADSLAENGRHLSERERLAISSERDMSDRLKLQYMAKRVGETFEGVISGVSNKLIFVELVDIPVGGAISLGSLTDDYYILDEKKHRFIGDISGRVLQVGNLVHVVLTDVDRYQNRIFFTLDQPIEIPERQTGSRQKNP